MFRDKRQIIKLIFLSIVFLLPQLVFSAASSDAIATRVIPNPNHLSVFSWYKKQKFTGSPQAMQVDGYEAVRDGRTVYVNAANIIGDKFYTNIYLLSFNQNVEQATQDIFRQLLAHWKFNTNIPPENKDNVRRDTKRLADLAEIKSALDNYQRNHHGDFPSLAAGSYISGKSLSVWPSWQATLAKELEITLPFDPINKLGICSTVSESENKKYDPVTCWDQRNKIFAGVPVDSRAYIYTYTGKAAYNICALMQSGYLTTLQGACPGSAVGYNVCNDIVWTPNSATTCSDKKINQTSNCGNTREVNGTKCCDKVWTPNTALNLVCSNQTVTETSDCGRTRNITHGTKTDTVWTPAAPPATVCANQTITETGDCGATRNTLHGTKTDGVCGGFLFKIVLSWTSVVNVNSHLEFSAAGVAYHLFTGLPANPDGSFNAGGSILDHDDRSTNGQETITIKSAEAGVKYRYYVNNAGSRTFRNVVKVELFDEFGASIHKFIANPPLTPQDMTHANLWNIFSFIPSVGASSLVIQDTYEFR